MAIGHRVLDQAHDGLASATVLGFEVRQITMRERQIRRERERGAECLFCEPVIDLPILVVLSEHTISASECGPRRRKAGILMHRLPEEIPRPCDVRSEEHTSELQSQ